MVLGSRTLARQILRTFACVLGRVQRVVVVEDGLLRELRLLILASRLIHLLERFHIKGAMTVNAFG